MHANQFLLIPENREMVKKLSERVLTEFEPEQVEMTAGFIDPLLDMAVRDEVVTIDTSDEAGGFGGADLMVMVVVPVVVGVMSSLLTNGMLRLSQQLRELKQHWGVLNQKSSELSLCEISEVTDNEKERFTRLINELRLSRLSSQLELLTEQWELLSQKLVRLQTSRILETKSDEKFRLEQIIKECETERQKIDEKLRNLENQAQAATSQIISINVDYDDVGVYVERTGARINKRKIRQLTKIIEQTIREYLASDL